MDNFWFVSALVVVGVILFFRMLRVVPEQRVLVIEEWGKYKKTLGSGLHFIVPIIHRVAYTHDLKEEVLDVAPQVCITQDNVQVTVDGILYFKVMDPVKASYGIDNFRYATMQLAQTTMRSEIGKIELDRTFSERETINNSVVKAIDEASDPWGIKVTRYEIRDIEPAQSVIAALESQVAAERQKRAEILESEGNKESRINLSKGEREEAVNLSKGEKQKRINEAEGLAKSIEIVSTATAEGIKVIATAINKPKGRSALTLQIANQYIGQLGNILEKADVSVLPLEAAQLQGLAQAVMPSGGSHGNSEGLAQDALKGAMAGIVARGNRHE